MRGILLAAVAAAACTTFHGVKPTDPSQGNPNWPPRLDSVQPTLRWEPGGPGVTYDLAIIDAVEKKSGPWSQRVERHTPGRTVYHREGLTASVHAVEEPLEYDKLYYWSVRIHDGNIVSKWSTYDYDFFAVVAWSWVKNTPFQFRTPAAPPAPAK